MTVETESGFDASADDGYDEDIDLGIRVQDLTYEDLFKLIKNAVAEGTLEAIQTTKRVDPTAKADMVADQLKDRRRLLGG